MSMDRLDVSKSVEYIHPDTREGVHMSVLDDIRIDPSMVIDFYPYQSAQVFDLIEELKRKDYADLERKLLDAVNQELPNNKYIFAVSKTDGSVIYIWFYDDDVWVGNTIKVGQR